MEQYLSTLVLSDDRYHRIKRHLIFWIAAWIFFGIIYGFYASQGSRLDDFIYSFVNTLFYLPQHIALSYGIIYFILPRYAFEGKYIQAFILTVLFILLTAFLSPVISVFILDPLWGRPEKPQAFFYGFMAGLRGTTTVAGFATAIKVLKYWYLKKEESSKIEKEKLRAELQLLKGQLHPHFMFNTLNSIYSLALHKSEKTPTALLQLSELMRYMMKDAYEQTLPLATEIHMIRNYIALEKNRFGERLEVNFHIEGHVNGQQVAPLLFMPFIENSFKYGTAEVIEQAWVNIDFIVAHDEVTLKVMNATHAEREEPGTRIGLQNVKRRLSLLYPSAHELRILNEEETFVVVLNLKLTGLNALAT